MAGLSAALQASGTPGLQVVVHEAGPAAGGRCRTFHDRKLDIEIDNGNHLLLSGNREAARFLEAIGAGDKLDGPGTACFPFVDIKTGERWTVRPSAGRIPWWILAASRRVPETRLRDYTDLLSLVRVSDDRPVSEVVPRGELYCRLVEPLAIAALNTSPQQGLARLMGAVMRETLMRGGKACVPLYPKAGLSGALVDPAVAYLQRRGVSVRFSQRIAGLSIADNRVTALNLPEDTIPVGSGDSVVLAVPAWVATDLLPGLTVPDSHEAIVNIHFRFDLPGGGALAEAGFIGILGGTAEWLFHKQRHLSVTVSAANRLVDTDPDVIAATVWADICAALGISDPLPPFRVIKEKRATFAATAEQERRRPQARTHLANLALAGDWTATGLPATIEGAIRSGRTAASVLLAA